MKFTFCVVLAVILPYDGIANATSESSMKAYHEAESELDTLEEMMNNILGEPGKSENKVERMEEMDGVNDWNVGKYSYSCLSSDACENAENGSVGKLSCLSSRACGDFRNGRIGDNSCVLDRACENAQNANVGGQSCHHHDSCRNFRNGSIGDSSCKSRSSCLNAIGNIGNGSCQSKEACHGKQGSVGNRSCLSKNSCRDSRGRILDNSCIGNQSCANLRGVVKSNSCTGLRACNNVQGRIGSNSCKGDEACSNYEGVIPDNCNSVADLRSGNCGVPGPPPPPQFRCRDNQDCIRVNGCTGKTKCKNGTCVEPTGETGDTCNYELGMWVGCEGACMKGQGSHGCDYCGRNGA